MNGAISQTTNSNIFFTNQKVHIGAWQSHWANEIILLSASVNYTEIFFVNGKKLVVATPLKTLESRLKLTGLFYRTHKSYLINIQHIKDFQSINSYDFIEMKNNKKALISRRRRVAFKRLFFQRILTKI